MNAMDNRPPESGLELVLDNRKLIVAFALLIILCGSFFVLGFIEGKRQGVQEGTQAAVETLSTNKPKGEQGREAKPANADAKVLKERPVQDQLDWYNSVNRKEKGASTEHTASSSPGGRTEIAKPSPASEPAVKRESAQIPSAAPIKPTYSVQVGAFRQVKEAETEAQMLKSKGYDCRIEPPHVPEQLFLLKVGKFDSRAEAVAMQLRLKKDGFFSFVKTN